MYHAGYFYFLHVSPICSTTPIIGIGKYVQVELKTV